MSTDVGKQPLLVRLLGLRGSSQERLGQVVRIALIIFLLLAIGFTISSFVVGYRINQYLVQTASLAIDSRDVDRSILEMRRNEKDFVVRQTAEELDNHAQNYEKAQVALKKLETNPRATAEEKKVIVDMQNKVEQYRNLFLQVVETYIAKGLMGQSEMTGLNAQLREAAVQASEDIAKSGSLALENAMLLLRGETRDFVIFEQEKQITQFDQRMKHIQQVLASTPLDAETRNRLAGDLKRYAESFKLYAEKTFDAQRILEQAREQAHEAQAPIPGFAEAASKRRDAQARQLIAILAASTGLLLLLFMGVGILLRNAQTGADTGYAETLAAQKKAEDENEQLNNSVISILGSLQQLSERDLTVRALVTTDIIGTVSDSINALTDETSRVLLGVTDIAGQVSQVSNKVKMQAEQVSKTAEQERQNVNQMVESLFEATQTMNQVAALAEQSNLSAEQATEVTDNALETVTGTVREMESIRETIAETEKRIKRLGERSQEISGIVNLINTISERTHVLALNASMQAAVAGEAGRGFAVVAEEVQRLAESSRNATQQIATLVSNIQIETNETINTVNRTIGQVVQGSTQAQKAGEQMRQTQEITAKLVDQVRSIAHASEQQKSMSAQLLEAVQRIGESTENTAQQIEAQNQETDTLLSAARHLVDSVSVFKLPQTV